MSIRLRFCPSPTGYAHVGLLRTALFNSLYRDHVGGKLILRIEDTDSNRNCEGSYENILNSLYWLKISWDEGPDIGGEYGPYIQSLRGDVYKEIAYKLEEIGYVYKCYCDQNCNITTCNKKLSNYRYRFSTERIEDVVEYEDYIYGSSTLNKDQYSNFYISRSDGTFLYIFTNPVDDYLMRITDIVRGIDLRPSTFKQIMILEALNVLYNTSLKFHYAHIPFVVDRNRKKLSKRDNASNIYAYIKEGYLPEAFLNYISLLGWSPKDNSEIISRDRLVKVFSIKNIKKSSAIFDVEKCKKFNGIYIRNLSNKDLLKLIYSTLQSDDVDVIIYNKDILSAVDMIRSRISTFSEIYIYYKFLDPMYKFLLEEIKSYDNYYPFIKELYDTSSLDLFYKVSTLKSFTLSIIDKFLSTFKRKDMYMLLRLILLSSKVSLPIFETMYILNYERVKKRLKIYLDYIDD